MLKSKIFPVILIILPLLAGAYLQSSQLQDARSKLATLQPGYIDVSFSQHMSLHHQQAVAMAQLMLDGRPTGLGALARKITSTQLIELGEMRGWLRLWNKGLNPASPDMSWMLMGKKPLSESFHQYVINCGQAPGGMIGLATLDQLDQLRLLEGRARDELFLKLMLAHHEGGVPMALFAAEEATLPVVRNMAGKIVLDQSREIQQIQSMLALVASHSPDSNPVNE